MNNSLSVHPEPYLKLPRNFGPHPSFKNKESKVENYFMMDTMVVSLVNKMSLTNNIHSTRNQSYRYVITPKVECFKYFFRKSAYKIWRQ